MSTLPEEHPTILDAVTPDNLEDDSQCLNEVASCHSCTSWSAVLLLLTSDEDESAQCDHGSRVGRSVPETVRMASLSCTSTSLCREILTRQERITLLQNNRELTPTF